MITNDYIAMQLFKGREQEFLAQAENDRLAAQEENQTVRSIRRWLREPNKR